MDRYSNPFQNGEEREPGTGNDYHEGEVGLAHRNHGFPMEMLQHDITPIGMHYLLSHFDIPFCPDPEIWNLSIGGLVSSPLNLKLSDLRALEKVNLPVTLECAGNGRSLHEKRNRSMPWHYDAIGTSRWSGTPLIDVINRAVPDDSAVEVAFYGADRGFDKGSEHDFARSLTMEQIQNRDILLVYEMNGQPLLPQHGFPLRLIVPGWYGMASVKWLNRIEVLGEPFDGFQQVQTYRYRNNKDDPGVPVSHIRVKSLMTPPGIPDWYSRDRLVDAGEQTIIGRAWSGNATAIEKVEFTDDGEHWVEAKLTRSQEKYAWSKWSVQWMAKPGKYVLQCRATDASGNVQPMTAPWDQAGFGNNETHKVSVMVR